MSTNASSINFQNLSANGNGGSGGYVNLSANSIQVNTISVFGANGGSVNVNSGGDVSLNNVNAGGTNSGGSFNSNSGSLNVNLINLSSQGTGGTANINTSGNTSFDSILATGSNGGGSVTINGNSGITGNLIDVSDPPYGDAGTIYLSSSGLISINTLLATAEDGNGGTLVVNAPVFYAGLVDLSSQNGRWGTAILNTDVAVISTIRAGLILGRGAPRLIAVINPGVLDRQAALTPPIYMGLGARAQTDLTPVPHGKKLLQKYEEKQKALQGGVEEIIEDNALLADGSVMNEESFDDNTLSAFRSSGVVSGKGSGKQFFNLDRGKVLFAPKRDITVQTHEATLKIAAGSHVWVVETGNDVAVFDLGDKRNGDVQVINGAHHMMLLPGQGIILTRKVNADFDKINPANDIAYRNLESVAFGSGVKAHAVEFSIVGALNNVPALHKLHRSESAAERRLVAAMLKNAAILTMVMHNTQPFKVSRSAVAQR